MSLDVVSPEDVNGRSAVQSLLPERPKDALARAREIRHPWYRCQALASVAEAMHVTSEILKILAESFAAAYEQSEPNRVVSVASWPLKHLVEIGVDHAATQVETLLAVAASEPHGLRRLDALNRVLWAVAPEASLRTRVAEAFLSTSNVCTGWRTKRTVASMAEYIAIFDLALAKRMLATREPNRFGNKALDSLRAHELRNDA
jgi:hypothetical protein